MTTRLPPDTCVGCERTLNINSWCQCQNERSVQKFNTWTSNDIKMDNIIQLTQRCAQKSMNSLEWIPFDDLDFVKFKSRGSFSTIYSAKWMDGPRNRWDKDDTDWVRNGPMECALKRIENSQSLSTEYLDNVSVLKHHQYLYGEFMADFFGISRDPKGCFIFVMRLYDKNLYQYIDDIENFRWENVIFILRSITYGLKRIHDNGHYHSNLHGGNLFISANNAVITDVGLYELCEMLDSWATVIQHNPTSTISRQFRDTNRERSVFENRTIDPRAIYICRLLNFIRESNN
ncbi:43522_t:CDS:2 [Gigaspora margarita]|uniref:43522_t:CDS:1 n=1 Tax=Gigaspora margarita TaxID=4874 RepID=A0ABN7VN07_GIGMA|nr:43522_t:CDS:2 [Gigaspora margarita]